MTTPALRTCESVARGRRLAARAVDLALAGFGTLALLTLALAVALSGLDCAGGWIVARGVGTGAAIVALALILIGAIFPLLFEAGCTWLWGRTPGKMLFGLSAVQLDGSRLSPTRTLVRASFLWLPVVAATAIGVLGLGPGALASILALLAVAHVLALFASVMMRKPLHDRWSGARLVHGSPRARTGVDVGLSTAARRMLAGAATVIGLLVLLAVLKPFGGADSGKLEVLTTSALLADLVRGVGGDSIEVSHAFTSAGEGHRVDPTRRQRNAVRGADVVIAFGTYDADFTIRTGAEAIFVERSDSNPSLLIDDLKSAYERRYPDRILFAARDLHTWLSIPNARIMVAIIRDALIEADPDNADVFEANAGRYLAVLDSTDAYIREQVSQVPDRCRTFVTDREFLTYYAEAYGFTTLGPAVSPFGNQPEAKADRDEMVALIRRSPVKKIFVHEGAADSVSQVATPAVSDVIELYADELASKGSGVETYVDLMRANTQRIVEALQVC